MNRLTIAILLSLPLMACSQRAESQESPQPEGELSELTASEVSEQIFVSRQTAITRAVEIATPAVVSVNVTGVRQVQYRDPFGGMNDPFFDYFFGRNRSRIVDQEVHSVGSGFVISTRSAGW